jgi:rubrerythrin
MIEKLTLQRAIEFAIKTEQVGGQLYKKLATQHAGERELAEMFELLARDEEAHEKQFARLRDSLAADAKGDLGPDDEEYLRAVATAEIFYGDNEASGPADKISSREDALQRALSLEKASLLYYSAMREVLGASAPLDAIIAAEKEHLVRVMRYMFTGAKMRGLIDEFP